MKNYVKPELELRALTASNVIASAGLDDWLEEKQLEDVGITTAYLTNSWWIIFMMAETMTFCGQKVCIRWSILTSSQV